MNKFLLIGALFLLLSCDSDCCAPEDTVADQLVGTWVAFESGNSDGTAYYVTPLPELPRQAITFRRDRSVSTNIDGLTNARAYDINIRTDTVPHPTIGGQTLVRTDTILAFYRRGDERRANQDEFTLHNWRLIDGDLYFYWGCIEGCHMGLRRVD